MPLAIVGAAGCHAGWRSGERAQSGVATVPLQNRHDAFVADRTGLCKMTEEPDDQILAQQGDITGSCGSLGCSGARRTFLVDEQNELPALTRRRGRTRRC
jgi:hypothetical protein